MRKLKFTTGEIYHIYNRGVEKRQIFVDDHDYFRFLLEMKEGNQNGQCRNLTRTRVVVAKPDSQEPLVCLISYCLMPNHNHFVVQQAQDDGIARFMHKLGTGYTMYFNKRYTRNGRLFQGVFKARHVGKDAYFLQVVRYVHLNPDELFGGVASDQGVRRASVENYKWSSLQFYLDRSKRCMVRLQRNLLASQFRSKDDFLAFTFSPFETQIQSFDFE